MKIAVLLLATYSVSATINKRSDNGTDLLRLVVGEEVMIPEVEEESDKENAKEANKKPSTDVIPPSKSDAEDKQEHDKKGKNIESGAPPKYPLKAESAETSAHDNEIGGCRDHPRAGLVCSKCENGNKCFPAEHESYTYSYCRRSCRHCDPSTSSFHTFWRLRAQSEFEPTWMLQQVEFYADPQEKISLVDDPEKAYASSVYTGYKPSFAFDNNNATAWYPSGWGNHDNNDDWIAYEFTVAVRVHGVRMVVDKDHATAQPKKVIVEASDKMYGPFSKKWTIYNTDYSVDKIYKLLECDVLWRRFEVEDGAWCFRLIAKLETWEGARKSCEIEGGDLATIQNKEEQRFITDEVGLCSHTWFGLSHTNQGYYWNDGSNSTYRNWKDQLTYSDVQKQTLNCAAMDPDGIWFNFHCSNKFYFVCKKRLVPRPDPRPDLTDNAWPYPPEVPPLIFFAPNVTVPVINSKNLEPGIFPDANGKVEGEEEEDITLSDLFYEQTVEHLKEKGLKPSEEIEADENQEETDFTQELNKIAINTSPGDFQNETKGDETKNNTGNAHKQEQDFENIPNKEANNAETSIASTDAPKPKPKHKDKPVPPPPEEGDESGDDNSYPEIKHGKPVEDSLKNKSRHGKKVPKGSATPLESTHMASEPETEPSLMSLQAGKDGAEEETAHKAENINKGDTNLKKKKQKPVHKSEEDGPHDKDSTAAQSTQNSSQGVKNKDVPMSPFTGPLGGPSLAQQNISKSARKKIKVLQPLESAATGEDYSIMSEHNKMKRKKVLSRAMIHQPKQDKFAAKKKRRNRHLNHLKHIKEHDNVEEEVVEKTNKHASRKDKTPAAGFPKEEDESELESGSGSGSQVETDNADIFPETEEEFWSK